MEKLIQELNEVLMKTNALNKKLSAEKKLNDSERQENKNKAAELNTRALEIVSLETKFKKIQKIASFETKVLLLQKETRAFAKQLKEDRADFERERNMLRAEINDVKDVYKRKTEELEKKHRQLILDRKNYKEDIQKTIDRQLREKGIRL